MKLIYFYKKTLLICFSLFACNTESSDMTEEIDESAESMLTPKTTYDITDILDKLTIVEGVSYEIKNKNVVIYSNGVPNHKSPYFEGTEWEEEWYEEIEGNNAFGTFRQNPNTIGAQDYEFRIPLYPTVASVKETTSLGPIGVTLNGVPFFNQYAGPDEQELTDEIRSFDNYLGHPTEMSLYHYHLEPVFLTETYGSDALLGVLLDGFPVYGPVENEITLSSDDLDEYHGHFSATEEFPEGIYHYHISADAPYINGDGFYGEAGTVSR